MSDVISCPSFHLERSLFGKEMVEDCQKSGGSNCSPVQVPVWSYEKLRRMLFWLEKEFGPKGRNLIPAIIEKYQTRTAEAINQPYPMTNSRF